MFGYSADEMIGQSIRRIIPADRQSEEDDVVSHIRRGEKVDHFETVRQHKNGHLVPISLTVSPIRDGRGIIVGASKIARDIHERKEAEAERGRLALENARLYRAAQDANSLKDDFLATLSHELRTPLNAILGYARMMRAGILKRDKLPRAVDTIERNAAALTRIVEDVLDISRIVSGKLRLNVTPVDLAELVRDAIDSVLPGVSAKGIDINNTLDDNAGSVPGDAERLQQVVWNILSNAVKFTERGGRIDVTLARRGANVQLTVSDTGIGIAPEFLPHIFERFRQADAGTTRERGGLGLGLAIARQLVEMHGGTIVGSSGGRGAGSIFTITLPITTPAVAVADGDGRPPHPHAERAAIPDLRGTSVLAVDDDDDALTMVRDILEASGASVSTSRSASDALLALQSRARRAGCRPGHAGNGRVRADCQGARQRRSQSSPGCRPRR